MRRKLVVATSTAPFVVPASGFSGIIPTVGLVNLWPMNNANVSGSTVIDTISGNNGTIVGSVVSAPGPNTQSLAFDGSTGYISVGDTTQQFEQNHSIFWWGYVNDNTAVGTGGFGQRFFNLCNTAADTAVNASCNSGADAGQFQRNDGNVLNPASTPGAIPSTTWTMLGYTYSTVGPTAVLYVNGAVPTAGTGSTPGVVNLISVIGARDTSLNGLLAGRMYNLAVYNRVLSAAEALQFYNAG